MATLNFESPNNLSGATVANVDAGGGAYAITPANLLVDQLNIDPGGGAMTATLPLGTVFAPLLPADGSKRSLTVRNTADAAENLTMAGNTGGTLRRAEGAADLVIAQNQDAILEVSRLTATTYLAQLVICL